MWEKFIRRIGFRNVYKGGQATGFQFKIHIPYYRGIFLSCLSDAFMVKVDGVRYPSESISLKVGDRVIPYTQIDAAYDVFWPFGDLLTVIVDKPGGLEPGLRVVECGLAIRKSYIPAIDPQGLYENAPIPREEKDIKREKADGFTSSDAFYQFQSSSLAMTLVM